jgi:hypothetical protein
MSSPKTTPANFFLKIDEPKARQLAKLADQPLFGSLSYPRADASLPALSEAIFADAGEQFI